MNIALVDDMEMDLDRVEQVLQKYASLHRLDLEIRRFGAGEALLADYRPFQYSIIFLDIYMEGLSGMETARRIREVDDDVMLVFLTTSEEYRADAFAHYASAYLVKPPGEDLLFRTMDHLLHLRTEKEGRRFSFLCDKKEVSLRCDDIVCLQASGNYVVITDRQGMTWRTRMRLSDAQKALAGDGRFLSIIRGVLVNLDHVLEISGGTCSMAGDISFPVSSLKRKSTLQIWHNYNFQKIRWASPGRPEEE